MHDSNSSFILLHISNRRILRRQRELLATTTNNAYIFHSSINLLFFARVQRLVSTISTAHKYKWIKWELIFFPSHSSNYLIHNRLKYDPKRRIQFWRFITYLFLHSDPWHIGGNLVMQICFGIPLELVNHWWRVTLTYLAGVLAGSMAQSITSRCPMVGASGGVYALIVAHVATVIMVNISVFLQPKVIYWSPIIFRTGRRCIIHPFNWPSSWFIAELIFIIAMISIRLTIVECRIFAIWAEPLQDYWLESVYSAISNNDRGNENCGSDPLPFSYCSCSPVFSSTSSSMIQLLLNPVIIIMQQAQQCQMIQYYTQPFPQKIKC